jgi:hypothetical protein
VSNLSFAEQQQQQLQWVLQVLPLRALPGASWWQGGVMTSACHTPLRPNIVLLQITYSSEAVSYKTELHSIRSILEPAPY